MHIGGGLISVVLVMAFGFTGCNLSFDKCQNDSDCGEGQACKDALLGKSCQCTNNAGCSGELVCKQSLFVTQCESPASDDPSARIRGLWRHPEHKALHVRFRLLVRVGLLLLRRLL